MASGAQPEVLLLQGLKADNGLPIGYREVEMIAQARLKKDLENNALPMTDEACFSMRKRMMENQELREIRIREVEIDQKFEERLVELQKALEERADTHEFLASQRVESIRQARMDEREKVMQKIRKNRIQVLRRLARKRNEAEPTLSGTAGRDIINEYFDRGSTVYAPLKREGATVIVSNSSSDVASRSVPLNTVDAITNLEQVVPRRFSSTAAGAFHPDAKLMSKTWSKGGGRAAEHRLTSAAQRSLRNTKSDIEMMHELILNKKRKIAMKHGGHSAGNSAYTANSKPVSGTASRTPDILVLDSARSAPSSPHSAGSGGDAQTSPKISPTAGKKMVPSALLAGKPKGRPDTPDIASRTEVENSNHNLKVALILLQKLIRGRAVQNKMYEGRHRNKELIMEMRQTDDMNRQNAEDNVQISMNENKLIELKMERVARTTMSCVIGSLASNALVLLAQEFVSFLEFFDVRRFYY